MKRRILVVDDEEYILGLLDEVFHTAGYEVALASNGMNALELFKKGNNQVVILDLRLPDMSGVELGSEMKGLNPIAIIFAMTGYTSLFQLADCREAGFDDYFQKPVNLDLLTKSVDEAFLRLERWKGK